jgi:hypothetical protein
MNTWNHIHSSAVVHDYGWKNSPYQNPNAIQANIQLNMNLKLQAVCYVPEHVCSRILWKLYAGHSTCMYTISMNWFLQQQNVIPAIKLPDLQGWLQKRCKFMKKGKELNTQQRKSNFLLVGFQDLLVKVGTLTTSDIRGQQGYPENDCSCSSSWCKQPIRILTTSRK